MALGLSQPVAGTRNTLSLGTYLDVGLADARAKHSEAHKMLAAGVDAGEQRKAERVASSGYAANTFATVGDELLKQRAQKLVAGLAGRITWTACPAARMSCPSNTSPANPADANQSRHLRQPDTTLRPSANPFRRAREPSAQTSSWISSEGR